jgi:hypothetical protein
MSIRIIATPEQKADAARFMRQQFNDLTRGKISIRWNNARCGYVIYSGRNVVLGLESFMTEQAAEEWLWETHGLITGGLKCG